MDTAAPASAGKKPGFLINRNFALLWGGQSISNVGDYHNCDPKAPAFPPEGAGNRGMKGRRLAWLTWPTCCALLK